LGLELSALFDLPSGAVVVCALAIVALLFVVGSKLLSLKGGERLELE
jgi:hypothetical protein